MATIFNKDEKLRQFLEGTASQEVKEEVREWAASDPEHQAELEALQSLWDGAAGAAVYREIDSQADWHKVRQRLQASETAPSGGTSSSSTAARRRIWAMAATVLLLATLSFFFLRRGDGPEMLIAQTGDAPQELTLADGSQVSLRPHSRLQYPKEFDGDQRRLELEAGAAFFDVQRNPAKPFIVESGPSLVEVKGTSFTVSRDGENTSVAVKTGKVRFYLPQNASADVLLTPGQQASLGPQSNQPALASNSPNEFSWTSGQLVFDQAPIQQVLHDLGRHFNVKFSTGTQFDTTKTLDTEFIDQSLEEVLQEMQVVLGIQYRIENDQVFVE